MPRNGDGSSDNGPFEGTDHNIAHGVGQAEADKVARADKTAPMPEPHKGAGLEGMNASGGQSQGIKTGDNVGQGRGSKGPSN